MYAAGLSFGISEFDVLQGAQNNSFGYLSSYKEFGFLSKSWYLLRPINVPFKNKWLRDVTNQLCRKQENEGFPRADTEFILQRILNDLELLKIQKLAKGLMGKVK